MQLVHDLGRLEVNYPLDLVGVLGVAGSNLLFSMLNASGKLTSIKFLMRYYLNELKFKIWVKLNTS